MGTRADFYVGRGVTAEWLGSITWDGHPTSIAHEILEAQSEEAFRTAVETSFASRGDVTRPADGWPWPWEDSRMTDYAYAFDEKVWISRFGRDWYAAEDGPPEGHNDQPSGAHDRTKDSMFPDMSERRVSPEEVLRRSGLIFLGRGYKDE